MTKKHFWGLEASDPPSYSGKSPLKNHFFAPLSSSILWSFGLKDAKLSGWLARQIILTLDFFVGSSQTWLEAWFRLIPPSSFIFVLLVNAISVWNLCPPRRSCCAGTWQWLIISGKLKYQQEAPLGVNGTGLLSNITANKQQGASI